MMERTCSIRSSKETSAWSSAVSAGQLRGGAALAVRLPVCSSTSDPVEGLIGRLHAPPPLHNDIPSTSRGHAASDESTRESHAANVSLQKVAPTL
jgi:hypothetical protein